MKPVLLLSLALVPLASALPAQKDKIANEVLVLRGLAKDWGFVELAKEHLESLRKSPQTSEDDQKRLAQVAAEVLYLGARRIRDLDKRQVVLADALQQFKDYLEQYGRSEDSTPVLTAYAEASEYYGKFLADKIGLEKDPDKKKELEEEALNVFVAGIKASNDATQALEARKGESPQLKIQYYLAWLRKGTLLRTWAETRAADREVKADEAIQTLEDLALSAGEETPIGVKALLEMGVALDVKGDTRDGIDTFVSTIDMVKEQLEDDSNPLPLGTQGLLFNFMQEATMHLTNVYVRDGRGEDAIKASKDFRDAQKTYKLPPQLRFQDVIFLNEAQAQMDAGGNDNTTAALAIAKEVASRHKSDFVGVRARGLISKALETDVEVGIDALMESAKGDLQASKFGDSVRGYKRAIRTMSKSEDKAKYGLRAHADMGLAFARQQRYLEAIYAWMKGLQTFGPQTEDDKVKATVVNYLNSALVSMRRQKSDKDFVAQLKSRVDSVSRRYADEKTKASRAFTDARSLINDGKFAEAIKQLGAVDKKTAQYELSRTMIAFAQYRQGDFNAARRTISTYLKFANDPLNRLAASETQKSQYRNYALADANFYIGKMLADEAFGREVNGVKRKPDPSKLKEVVTAFRNFGKDYGKIRKKSATIALFEMIAALIDLEKVSEAEAEYAAFRKENPNDALLGGLAIKLFKARQTNIAAIDQEIEAVAGDPTKARALRDANQRLRSEVRKALAFAKNYLEVEAKPNYQLLRDASQLGEKIEDFDQAEFFLEKVLAVYGKSKAYKAKVDKFVRPDLASIKMRKGDFNTALKQIEDALAVRPKSYELKLLKIRALGGWAEIDNEGTLREITGLKRFSEAYDLLFQDYRKFIRSKFKPGDYEYYKFRFDCMYACKMAATQDSNFLARARKFFRMAKSEDEFDTLKKLGAKGRKLFQLFQRVKP